LADEVSVVVLALPATFWITAAEVLVRKSRLPL